MRSYMYEKAEFGRLGAFGTLWVRVCALQRVRTRVGGASSAKRAAPSLFGLDLHQNRADGRVSGMSR